MNLHLSHYPNSFIGHFIINEEKYSRTENRYIVYNNNLDIELKNEKLEIASSTLESLFETIGDLSKYKFIYIHYLSTLLIDFVNALPADIKVVWIFWGADGFSQIKGYDNEICLEEKTAAYHHQNLRTKMQWCKNPVFLYKNYKTFRKKLEEPEYSYQKYLKATSRIDFFAHYLFKDYELIKANSALKAKYINFNYLANEQCVIPALMGERERSENNIIIGNSANYSNNHLDIFEKISNYDLSNVEKIYAPLSYSGTKHYVDTIVKDGEEKFKEKFEPLINFLPLSEYYALLKTVNLAVFNMIRSQAAGNVVALLLQGTRVYLNPKNILYLFLKENGILLFNTEVDLKKDFKTNNIGWLSEEECQLNIEALERIYGEEAMSKKYNDLLKITD